MYKKKKTDCIEKMYQTFLLEQKQKNLPLPEKSLLL